MPRIVPTTYDDPLDKEFTDWRGPAWAPKPKPRPKRRLGQPVGPGGEEAGRPVPDPFPLLANASAGAAALRDRLLRPAAVNAPPDPHVPEATPLLIGFTRNWPQLLQCVCSYMAAGWPPGDIVVVKNTGVMRANREGRLSLQNPFFLNYTHLAMLGVEVITVWPAFLSVYANPSPSPFGKHEWQCVTLTWRAADPDLDDFAQLQNFYAW